MTEDLKDLIGALAKAQGEFLPVIKASNNTFFKSKYADLTDIVRTIQPTLTEHGLVVSQFPSSDDRGPTLVTYLMHVSGQYLVHSMPLFLPKDDPQGQGSAITYARRYAYCSVLGVVADADDDGNRASHPMGQRNEGSQEYEEEDVQETQRFNQLMTEAVEGKEKYGDLWAQALREQAETEGHQTVNAWFRADPDAAEIFVTSHKLKAEMTLRQNQEPVEHGGIPDDAAAPPKRTRAKAGSAVKPEEDHAAAARRVMDAFPDAEIVDEDPELDLS